MIFLYILLGILALLVLLSLAPIKICVLADEQFSLKIEFLFWKQRLLPQQQSEKSQNETAENKSKKLIGKGGVFSNIGELFNLLKILFSKVLWIVKKIKIHKLKSVVTIATEDAAKTGVEYGAACSLIYPALGFLGSMTDISAAEVEVKADFDSNEMQLFLNCEISLKLLFALIAAVSALWQYIKIRYKNNDVLIQNERKK